MFAATPKLRFNFLKTPFEQEGPAMSEDYMGKISKALGAILGAMVEANGWYLKN